MMRSLQICCLVLAFLLVVAVDGKKRKKDDRSLEQQKLDEMVDRFYDLGKRHLGIYQHRRPSPSKGGRKGHERRRDDRWRPFPTARPIYRWTTDRPFWKDDDSSDSSSDGYKGWGFGSWGNLWDSSSEESSDSSDDTSMKSHKHSKHKHSESEESSSWESSSESSEETWTERLNKFWCKKWCWKWATHFKNFNRLFPNAGFAGRINRHLKKLFVKPYCTDLVESSGLMCNSNKTENVTMTTDIMPTTTEMEPRPWRRCRSGYDCEQDECCAMRNERDVIGLYCTRHSREGERCTSNQYWMGPGGQQRMRPSLSCPCADGLECESSSVAGKRYRYPREGICQAPTVTGSPTVTMDPDVTTTLPSNNTEPSNNITDGVPCTDHMDCPFFQCCSNMTVGEFDVTRGTCMSFSSDGDYCSKLDNLLEQPVVPACPCQSFLTCSSSSTDDSLGVCV